MTVAEAKAELTRKPLEFGNEKQIAAVRFLEQIEAAENWIKENGDPEIECQTCHGTGEVTCDNCDGNGVICSVDFPFSQEIFDAVNDHD